MHQKIDLNNYFAENLEQYLASFKNNELNKIIKYTLSSPAKRIRPLLVLASAVCVSKNDLKKTLKAALPSALALELIHNYTLVHDDLPSMDNDIYRRGKLSVHAKFGEAAAILAGDALLTEGFLVAAGSPVNAAKIISALANYSGKDELILGQYLDIENKKKNLDKKMYVKICQLKTASLFECAFYIGGLSQDASTSELSKLKKLGAKFGLAFQMRDDYLDKENLTSFDLSSLKDISFELQHELKDYPNKSYLIALTEALFNANNL